MKRDIDARFCSLSASARKPDELLNDLKLKRLGTLQRLKHLLVFSRGDSEENRLLRIEI